MFGGTSPLPIRLTPHADGWSVGAHAAVARETQAFYRVADFAALRFTAGTAGSLTGFTSQLGIGLQYRPTITSTGAGVGVITFDPSYEDDFGERVITNIVSAEAGASGATAGVATFESIDAHTVRIRRFDLTGTPTTGEVFVTLQQRVPDNEKRRIGHYGAAQDKAHTQTEEQPYAYWLYRQWVQARGSGLDTNNPYLFAENLAMARFYTLQIRSGECINANALARSCGRDGLERYVRDFALTDRPGETFQEQRQRAAAFQEAPRRNDPAAIIEALRDLLGPLFVRIWYFDKSTALTAPPAPTFWPGVNPGPAAYDLGGGTWLSSRAHLTIEVRRPEGLDLRRYLELLNVEMFRMLTVRLPATHTFDWATDISDASGNAQGFLLDLSDMDFAGMV